MSALVNLPSPVSDLLRLSPLESAILETVAYADVFDYALTIPQIHRYLHKLAAGQGQICSALLDGRLIPYDLSLLGGFVTLAGREYLVGIRHHRAELAANLFPTAAQYGRLLGRLPFVRMVALTGSLAVGNASEAADFDYFILAEAGRVWTCRAVSLLLSRFAKAWGHSICPNFIISSSRMILQNKDIYNAHELTQMIPLAGFAHYHELRRLNAWSAELLPNALGPPPHPLTPDILPDAGLLPRVIQKTTELFLRTRLGDWLEEWEMRRKIRQLERHKLPSREVRFSADWCQGHFDRHAERTLTAYRQRLAALPVAPKKGADE